MFTPGTVIVLVACLAAGESGCAPAPPAPQAKGAGNRDTGYSAMVAQLTALDRKAEALFQAHKPDDAAALIERGELLAKQLLAVPKPSLEATEAASDLDDLYARMLLSNRHYGWARLLFQKNLARWRHWEPRTPETDLRVKRAQDAIAECDRLL